jgi:hypothetical protein
MFSYPARSPGNLSVQTDKVKSSIAWHQAGAALPKHEKPPFREAGDTPDSLRVRQPRIKCHKSLAEHGRSRASFVF